MTKSITSHKYVETLIQHVKEQGVETNRVESEVTQWEERPSFYKKGEGSRRLPTF